MRALKSIGALLVLTLMARSAGAALDPLTLEKTVGLDPNVCATADAITVTAGTDVTYCYEVTNNSGITLNTHDLFDDQLGTLLTSFPYTLANGASAFLTATTTITVTTVNIATWTASSAFNNTAIGGAAGWGPPVVTSTASDSAIVNVLPATEPDAGPDGCSDGEDNDQDGLTDCADPDCVNVSPCVAPAPALGAAGMVVAGLLLLSIGAGSLVRRRS